MTALRGASLQPILHHEKSQPAGATAAAMVALHNGRPQLQEIHRHAVVMCDSPQLRTVLAVMVVMHALLLLFMSNDGSSWTGR